MVMETRYMVVDQVVGLNVQIAKHNNHVTFRDFECASQVCGNSGVEKYSF